MKSRSFVREINHLVFDDLKAAEFMTASLVTPFLPHAGISVTPITLDHMENAFAGNMSETFNSNMFKRRMLRSESNSSVYEPQKR